MKKELPLPKKLGGPRSGDIQRRFQELVRAWRRETRHLSSITQMAMRPAYQEIIRLGEHAVLLLLAELRHKPDHWFFALYKITGANPVPPESEGKINEMAQAWVRWGLARGYIE
jgi:hypothetical protein